MHKKEGQIQARFDKYRFFTGCYLEEITVRMIADLTCRKIMQN